MATAIILTQILEKPRTIGTLIQVVYDQDAGKSAQINIEGWNHEELAQQIKGMIRYYEGAGSQCPICRNGR